MPEPQPSRAIHRVTPYLLAELSNALSSSYLSVTQVDEFLRTKLDRRYNNLASRLIPLDEAIFQIVQKACDQGWLGDLVREAADDRPRNATLRTLRETLPPLDPSHTPHPGRSCIDRPSLLCGRASQWNDVCQSAPARLHQVLLVPGGRGQEPMHFRERVQIWLSPNPLRTIVGVHWLTPPTSLQEMIEALAVALGAPADGLQSAIRDKLAYQNLVLLHPCISEGFDQPHFIEYYTQWMPAALTHGTAGVLKCLQPVEWPVSQQPAGLLSRLLRRADSSDGRDHARRLIGELRRLQPSHVRILDLDELLNLEPGEIEQFLEGSEFPAEHQKILFARLMSGPQIPGYLFDKIDEYWKHIAHA